MKDPIHRERFFTWILILRAAVLVAYLLLLLANPQHFAVTGIILILVLVASILWQLYRGGVVYDVYEDRIELMHPWGTKTKEVIPFDDILQARFEDGFGDNLFNEQILLYPKVDATLPRQKEGRLALSVFGVSTKKNMAKVLHQLQVYGVQVMIKTNSSVIKEATGLRNWDEAG